MIGGMALFVLVAAILGSILGTGITGNLLQKENKKEAHFSTDYSVQKKTEENASQDTLREEVLSMETVAISLIIPGKYYCVCCIDICMVGEQAVEYGINDIIGG